MDLFGLKARKERKEKEETAYQQKLIDEIMNKYKDKLDKQLLTNIFCDILKMVHTLNKKWLS